MLPMASHLVSPVTFGSGSQDVGEVRNLGFAQETGIRETLCDASSSSVGLERLSSVDLTELDTA